MNQYVWKLKAKPPPKKSQGWLLRLLAQNRGLTSPKSLKEFLNPALEVILQVKLTDMEKGKKRVLEALKNKEKIIVYADYDADGLCATAIMWETLHDLGANVMPYVPHRIKEGYGMSKPAIDEMAKQGVKLIVTVDQGVTAVEQVDHAKKLGIDIVITDHHVLPKILPKAIALVHTTDLCGGGVAWRFCWEIVKTANPRNREKLLEKLELAALATIADLVPLVGANRAIVKLGLAKLTKTKRPGILALIRESRISRTVTTYEIGHILAPRINAMGRIEHGLTALRLLCTKNQKQADKLASLLAKTNTRRQDLTTKAVAAALTMVEEEALIGIVSHKDWHEGVIGLVASRLVESYNRPMVAIAVGSEFSKGSARSIPGFNIVEAIRFSSEFIIDGGGHPMAAGFTIRTKHIELFRQNLEKYAQKTITDDILERIINIECELAPQDITAENLKIIKSFEPYGVGNQPPSFLTRNMLVEDVRAVGAESQHLKLQVGGFPAIGFNLGRDRAAIRPGYPIDLVYTIEEDNFNGSSNLQLKIRDLALRN
ncbi:single-stranded-DNA-specific exonuclease RecJ [Candidatus Curtissbacteria bacterium]|nr:single-stranded-DNA-specific exonuclease RecJ [Candidatus Curtissbacteria bacterium]